MSTSVHGRRFSRNVLVATGTLRRNESFDAIEDLTGAAVRDRRPIEGEAALGDVNEV